LVKYNSHAIHDIVNSQDLCTQFTWQSAPSLHIGRGGAFGANSVSTEVRNNMLLPNSSCNHANSSLVQNP